MVKFSPSEVIVFNNKNHGNGNNRGGGPHAARNLPEVPQMEEIQQYLRDSKLQIINI